MRTVGTIQSAFLTKTPEETRAIIHRFNNDERRLLEKIYNQRALALPTESEKPLLDNIHEKITSTTSTEPTDVISRIINFITHLFEGAWFLDSPSLSSEALTKKVRSYYQEPQIQTPLTRPIPISGKREFPKIRIVDLEIPVSTEPSFNFQKKTLGQRPPVFIPQPQKSVESDELIFSMD